MKRIVILSLTILFLATSCSRLDLAVNLANTYLANKTDDFFDLTHEQSKWLKRSLNHDIEIIKKSIFPQLASEMFKVAEIISTHRFLETMTVFDTYKRFEGLFYASLKVFAPTAMALSEKLGPVQINYFQKEANRKFNEMKKDPERKSYKRIKRHFDSWIGSMTSGQKKDLKSFINKNPSPVGDVINHRQNLIHEFVSYSSDKIERKKFVERVFTNYESMVEPQYKAIINGKHKRVAAFVTNILNGLTENQRETLVETIRERANQIIKISRE